MPGSRRFKKDCERKPLGHRALELLFLLAEQVLARHTPPTNVSKPLATLKEAVPACAPMDGVHKMYCQHTSDGYHIYVYIYICM